jgi:Protein of unknown function (DUF4235)
MANPGGKLIFRLVSVAVGVPVGIAARKGIEKVWLIARPQDPPRTPTDPNVSWADALGYAALSAAGVAVGELVRYKSASTLYRGLTGSEPPVSKDKKAPAKDSKQVSVAG